MDDIINWAGPGGLGAILLACTRLVMKKLSSIDDGVYELAEQVRKQNGRISKLEGVNEGRWQAESKKGAQGQAG
jgi:hypothetical protein